MQPLREQPPHTRRVDDPWQPFQGRGLPPSVLLATGAPPTFHLETREYVRTGGDRIIDELICLEELTADKGELADDAVGTDLCEQDELLLLEWPRLFS